MSYNALIINHHKREGQIMTSAMTPHEKECALAAIAARIERAERRELKELRAWYREILQSPIFTEAH